MEFKKCKGPCGQEKPLTSYARTRTGKKFTNDSVCKPYFLSICKDCKSKGRANKKWDTKASNAIGREAKKWGFTVEQLHEWGITTNYVKSLFLDAWSRVDKNGVYSCVHCRQTSHICNRINPDNGSIIPLTPDDLTLDVLDRERIKRTRIMTCSNLRVICQTANLAKGTKDPTEYDIEVQETYCEDQSLKRGVRIPLREIQPATSPKTNAQLALCL